MKRSWKHKYAWVGAALACATVLGLMVVRAATKPGPWSWLALGADLVDEFPIYAYVALTSMTVFAGAGFFLGHQLDTVWQFATTDAGTRLPNRHQFEQRVVKQMKHTHRGGTNFSLLLIDLDGLKIMNDRGGHQVGDRALRLVAEAVRITIRARDFAARWGGDEFVVMVAGASADQALVLANRLRGAVTALAARDGLVPAQLSVSLGIAESTPFTDPHELFAAADRALYFAKKRGRNRAVIDRSAPCMRHFHPFVFAAHGKQWKRADTPMLDQLPAAANDALFQPTKTVLIVDDDWDNMSLLAEAISEGGYNVRTAVNGVQALAELEAYAPKLILLDLTMPFMNGSKFVEECRKRFPGSPVPIVLLSGAADLHTEAARLGVSAFLRKPFNLSDVTQLADRLLQPAA